MYTTKKLDKFNSIWYMYTYGVLQCYPIMPGIKPFTPRIFTFDLKKYPKLFTYIDAAYSFIDNPTFKH